jgi:hypothetical protein
MKVALCFSGQPRFIEEAYTNIYKTLIEPNDPDIFYHCWYDDTMVGKRYVDYNVDWDVNNNFSVDTHSTYERNTVDKIHSLYGKWIKAGSAEPAINFKDDSLKLDKILSTHASHYSREYFVNMLHSSWNSIMKSNMLKEEYRLKNAVKYDIVVRVRFDTTLNAVLDLSKLDYSKKVLYTDRRDNLPPRMIEDWFGFGNNDVMNIYSSGFLYMNEMIEESLKYDSIFCGEVLVYEMMKRNAIKHIPIDILKHIPIRKKR